MPKEPIAFWVPGQEWRAASFDESRMDDKTHGDGGDRAGRTERIVRCGPWDDGETIGNKCASHTTSLVGGSNALGEPIPCFMSFACSEFDTSILRFGPVAMVNGIKLATQGTCNPKGSVDGKGAIQYVSDSLIPMFDAHGG